VASLILIVAMFALLWLLLIRPQRQKQAVQQRLIESVEPGDEILTVGGLYGIVEELDEEGDLVVEIAEGIQVRVARRAVATVVKPDEDEDDEDDALDDETEEPLDEAEAPLGEAEAPLGEADREAPVNDHERAVSEAGAEDSTAARRS
jgi:preprotein translocase subunit YajC